MEWISKIELPKTEKEVDGRLAVRQRFKIAREFLAPLTKLIYWTFNTYKKGKTPMGRAMSKVLSGAIEGTYPNQYVNPAKVLISDGTLSRCIKIEVERIGNVVTVTFDPGLKRFDVYPDDGVILCAYNPSLRIAGINEEPSIRADGNVRIILPAQLKDQPVHLYLLFHTRDRKRFSRSVYLGEW